MENQLTFTCSKSTIVTPRKRYELRSKLTIKSPERPYWRRSGVCVVNFEYISYLFLSVTVVDSEQDIFSGEGLIMLKYNILHLKDKKSYCNDGTNFYVYISLHMKIWKVPTKLTK